MKAHCTCAIMALFFLITGCTSGESTSHGLTHSGQIIIRNGVELALDPEHLNSIRPAAGTQSQDDSERVINSYLESRPPSHCRLKDRFDRKEVIAYHFSDGKTKLGLDLDVDGFSLSELGDFDMQGAFINFNYRFQPIKKKREECLYSSSWQGLIGSGYNELVLRESHTVYQEIDQEIERAQKQVNSFLSHLP